MKDKTKKRKLMELLVKEVKYLKEKGFQPLEVLEEVLMQAANQTRCWGKIEALKQCLKEKNLQDDLKVVVLEVEDNPWLPILYQIWKERLLAVQKFDSNKARWITELNKRWRNLNCRFGNCQMFNSFKKMAKDTALLGLKDADGVIHEKWEEMEDITVHYFTKLFASEDVAEDKDIVELLNHMNIELTK
jgi:hypothetical protein